jgi:hypothetical protein
VTGTGYRPSPVDSRDLTEKTALYGVTIEQAEAVDLGHYEPPIWSQGNTNSCVAQSISRALYIVESQALEPEDKRAVLRSRKDIYYHGRRAMTPKWMPVLDFGSYPRAVISTLQKHGAAPESVWPWRKGTNSRPNFEALIAAHGAAGGSYFRVVGQGMQRTATIRKLLTLGLPVVFGTPVDTYFKSGIGPSTIGRPKAENIAGLHMMTCTGYSPSKQYGWVYSVSNSWGPGWRAAGGFDMTEDWMQWREVDDVWCIVGHEAIRRKLDKHPSLAKWRAVTSALEEARDIA